MKIKSRKLTLNVKLGAMIVAIIVPFAILVLYLLTSMVNYCNAYNQIVKNVTAANAYNINLRTEMDESVYQIVINATDFERIKQKSDVRDPYEILNEAREDFTILKDITIARGNQRRMERLLKTFDTLEKRIKEIEMNVIEGGHYEKNMFLFENNVKILTEVIQEAIVQYIYHETAHLESIRQDLEIKEQEAVKISVISFGCIVMGALVIGITITRSITIPISRLCKVTKRVSAGDFSVRAEVNASGEISTLTDSFNSMIIRMGEFVERITREERNLRDTELKLLQAQVNPHFLYNTLDAIIWLAEAKQTEQVVSMVSSLSNFFRTTLSKGKDYIKVSEELSHIKSYLEIQQFRYRDIMEYEVNIPEELYDYSILKLTLQPIVENALYHGIKNKREKGKIIVNGILQNGKLIFTVSDNGIGMQKEQLVRLQKDIEEGNVDTREKGGFGLVNVEERIDLNYGKEYGLTFDSEYGVGTRATITIPAIMYDEIIKERKC